MAGEWELVFSSVPHGIFRSSPFFLAIQSAYARAGEREKANLFFKLHELQTMSLGLSKVGRVAQVIDAKKKQMVSEFDTSIFSLTVLPIIGWFKLLPTFGGRVMTVANIDMKDGNILTMEVDYTTAKKISGLNGLHEALWNIKVPVNTIWKRLPWNKGHPPVADIKVLYVDDHFRIMEDRDGEVFVYTRPVFAESLSIPIS